MKSLLLFAFLASFSTPTNADMQSLLDNLKSHNEKIQAIKEINGRAIDSNVNFREKTVKQLVAIHDKQVKQLETCKTLNCFQSVINDNDALFNALKVKLTLDFLRKTNQLALKNCTDCKTAIATNEVK
jgi:hypothetical protein